MISAIEKNKAETSRGKAGMGMGGVVFNRVAQGSHTVKITFEELRERERERERDA